MRSPRDTPGHSSAYRRGEPDRRLPARSSTEHLSVRQTEALVTTGVPTPSRTRVRKDPAHAHRCQGPPSSRSRNNSFHRYLGNDRLDQAPKSGSRPDHHRLPDARGVRSACLAPGDRIETSEPASGEPIGRSRNDDPMISRLVEHAAPRFSARPASHFLAARGSLENPHSPIACQVARNRLALRLELYYVASENACVDRAQCDGSDERHLLCCLATRLDLS